MLVNIHEAKTHFSQLLKRALNGENIIIAKGGVPLICLVPYTQEPQQRQGGQLSGLIEIADDFDDPLPPDYLNIFYDEDKS